MLAILAVFLTAGGCGDDDGMMSIPDTGPGPDEDASVAAAETEVRPAMAAPRIPRSA